MSSSGTAWNSRDPSVATVDQLGRVVSKAAGSALIVACLVGACDSISVDVKQLVTEVEVTPATSVVEEGSSVQFSATARDPGGHPVQEVAFSWASTNPSVLAVDNSGRATGLQEGTATVRATASITGPGAVAGPQMTGQSGATVTTGGSSGPPPPPPPAGAPELPRTYINTAYQAPSGNTIRVRQGDDLQAKINSAQRGDILLLDANATFVGNFRLPPKNGSGWIVITTNTQLPPQGTRVTPSSASQFASLVSPNTDAALAVLPGASNYRIMGLEVTTAPNQNQSFFIMKLGTTGGQQNTLAEVPQNIIVDRTYIHGHPNLLGKRCIEMNASPAAVVDSYLSECHTRGQDSQAILSWNAPGPFKIVNNHLEGAGENVMFGGADPSIPNLIPSDIEIRDNYLYKPLSWKAQNWTVKNHFELKLGRRVLFENNILENNWVHAQDGFSVLIQSLNQGGNAPWSVVEHVTIRYNRLTNVAQGMNVLARWKQSPSQEANNILIENNVIEQVGFQSTYGGTGRAFQALDNVINLTIQNNTVFPGQAAVLFDGTKPLVNFVYQNNIAVLNNLGIAGSGKGSGNNALNHYAPGGTITNNLFVGGSARANNYPSGNHFLGNVAQVGFANVQAGDYRIVGTNAYSGIGADITGLNSRLANVLQGN